MSNYNVLVVEDSPTMRQLIIFALKRIRGLNIIEATDGMDGLKKLSENKFDLVLTDINMPVMDGLKLVSLLRKDPASKDIPVVVITTEGANEDRERALALGANEYIPKPIQTTKILDVARRFLNLNDKGGV